MNYLIEVIFFILNQVKPIKYMRVLKKKKEVTTRLINDYNIHTMMGQLESTVFFNPPPCTLISIALQKKTF